MQLQSLLAQDGGQQQSGAGTITVIAEQLWQQLQAECQESFRGYSGLTMAAHACDLLLHLAVVTHFCTFTDRQRNDFMHDGMAWLAPVPPSSTLCRILVLRKSYFDKQFVATSYAFRAGAVVPMVTVLSPMDDDDDPSFIIGQHHTHEQLQRILTAERRVLAQVKKLLAQEELSIRVVMVEPFIIPGGGRTYRSAFLQKLQRMVRACCNATGQRRVWFVADETLSYVRCGYPLFLPHLHSSLHADFVLIGKGLGSAVLLASQQLEGIESLHSVMGHTFSMCSSASALLQATATLRVLREGGASAHCLKEGKAMMEVLNGMAPSHAGARQQLRVWGLGYCMWVQHILHWMPLQASPNGRLLPRLDQDHNTLLSIISQSSVTMGKLRLAGDEVFAAARSPACAFCGYSTCIAPGRLANVTVLHCNRCTRAWHKDCFRSTKLRTCACNERDAQLSNARTDSE